jgi:hypothetical protein
VVPSSISFRGASGNIVNVYAVRKDGFTGPIKVSLKNPPPGFTSYPVTLSANQSTTKFFLKASLKETKEPLNLYFEGSAKTIQGELTHLATPAEDRMQAFLWRHLVPAEDLKAVVMNPAYESPSKRARRATTPSPEPKPATQAKPATETGPKPKFTKQQVVGRLRELKLLFEENLITDEFYDEKVQECETVQ